MATLQDKINDITRKHNFEIFADKISNGIKHTAFLSIYGDFISFDCKTLEEAKYLLETLKPINKNTIICSKDVKKYENESIIFNFGGVQIEKKGKVIFENKDFIRIKNIDGTIEQIYKDGRLK